MYCSRPHDVAVASSLVLIYLFIYIYISFKLEVGQRARVFKRLAGLSVTRAPFHSARREWRRSSKGLGPETRRTRGLQSPEGLERRSQPVLFRHPVLPVARAAQIEREHGSACHLPAAAATAATGNPNLHGESWPREPHWAVHAHRTGERPSSGGARAL